MRVVHVVVRAAGLSEATGRIESRFTCEPSATGWSVLEVAPRSSLPLMEDAILTLAAEVEAAWNAHDMERFANCFGAAADFVNVNGAWWQGRHEIGERHASSHTTRFKGSRMQLRVLRVREIAPGVAIVHLSWQLEGHAASGPRHTSDTRRGIWTWTVHDAAGRVEIEAAHNTDVLPPTH
jgi:uncharacterized protein (TIGR02246 family)